MTPTITTVEAARLAGVTVKQLKTWTARGLITPLVRHSALAWPISEIDRAELLGVLGRRLGQPDLFVSLAAAIDAGTSLVLPDGDFDVCISWRRKGESNEHARP